MISDTRASIYQRFPTPPPHFHALPEASDNPFDDVAFNAQPMTPHHRHAPSNGSDNSDISGSLLLAPNPQEEEHGVPFTTLSGTRSSTTNYIPITLSNPFTKSPSTVSAEDSMFYPTNSDENEGSPANLSVDEQRRWYSSVISVSDDITMEDPQTQDRDNKWLPPPPPPPLNTPMDAEDDISEASLEVASLRVSGIMNAMRDAMTSAGGGATSTTTNGNGVPVMPAAALAPNPPRYKPIPTPLTHLSPNSPHTGQHSRSASSSPVFI